MKRSDILITVVVSLSLALLSTGAMSASEDRVIDTFTRENSTNLGTTEDPNHYPWVLSTGHTGDPETRASLNNQSLLLGAGLYRTGVSVDTAFAPTDIDLSVDLSATGGYWSGVAYRQTSPGSMWDCYLVYCPPDGASVHLFYNGGIASAAISPTINWAVPHRLRVKAVGAHHEAWIDGVKYIDASDTRKLSGGYCGLMRDVAEARFDNLDVVSDGLLPAEIAASVGAAKTWPDGTIVSLSGPAVTR